MHAHVCVCNAAVILVHLVHGNLLEAKVCAKLQTRVAVACWYSSDTAFQLMMRQAHAGQSVQSGLSCRAILQL